MQALSRPLSRPLSRFGEAVTGLIYADFSFLKRGRKFSPCAGPYAGCCSSAVLGDYRPATGARGLNIDPTHPKRQYWGGGAVVQPVLGGWWALYVLRTAENTHSATKAAAAQGVDSGCTRAQASRMALGSVPMG
jgi:hypothetical protein